MATLALSQEAGSVFVGGPREEEEFVKVPLPGEFGFARREASVLHQLAWREGTQRRNRYLGLFRESLQGIGRARLRVRDRNARKSAEPKGSGLGYTRRWSGWPKV